MRPVKNKVNAHKLCAMEKKRDTSRICLESLWGIHIKKTLNMAEYKMIEME